MKGLAQAGPFCYYVIIERAQRAGHNSGRFTRSLFRKIWRKYVLKKVLDTQSNMRYIIFVRRERNGGKLTFDYTEGWPIVKKP